MAVCDYCGNNIAESRLKIFPDTNLCSAKCVNEIKDNFEEVQKSIVCLCISAVVRKTVSTLRFFEYLKFIRSLKVKIPKLKKKISEEILYHLNYSSLKILRVLSVFY